MSTKSFVFSRSESFIPYFTNGIFDRFTAPERNQENALDCKQEMSLFISILKILPSNVIPIMRVSK